MCEDTKLKAIHNSYIQLQITLMLSSMCEDTKLKAIHNWRNVMDFETLVVFNVRRY